MAEPGAGGQPAGSRQVVTEQGSPSPGESGLEMNIMIIMELMKMMRQTMEMVEKVFFQQDSRRYSPSSANFSPLNERKRACISDDFMETGSGERPAGPRQAVTEQGSPSPGESGLEMNIMIIMELMKMMRQTMEIVEKIFQQDLKRYSPSSANFSPVNKRRRASIPDEVMETVAEQPPAGPRQPIPGQGPLSIGKSENTADDDVMGQMVSEEAAQRGGVISKPLEDEDRRAKAAPAAAAAEQSSTQEDQTAPLEDLKTARGHFDWDKYLKETGSISAPSEYFKTEPPLPPLNNFKVGMKLEAVNRKDPLMICPATIGAVKGDEVLITFDGWGGILDYWCKYDSRDIFPVGWCSLTGDVLQPPGNIAKRTRRAKTVSKR